MASQYEEGPESKAVESGFALDELLRRERGANTRQARQLGFGAGQQKVQQDFQASQTEQQHQNRLAEMLHGENLKEQFAQKEAERGAPFIQQLVGGNPQVAKAFGYGQNVTTPGELPAPEAGYAGTPSTTAWQPRTPTMQEATGLSRAIPGITSTLLQQQLTGAQNKPMVVSKGAALVSPQGQLLYENKEDEATGAFKTIEEAQAMEAQVLKTNPALRGRTSIEQNSKGTYQLKLGVTDPVSENPNLWLAKFMDMNAPAAERIEAKMLYDKWFEDQGKLARMKSFESSQGKPLTEEAAKRLEVTGMAIASAYKLIGFSDKEREEFTGAGKLGWEAARLAAEAGLPLPFGYTKEGVERFSEFKKNNGMIEQYKFAVGGKQLTEGEQRVVDYFIPTGREYTTREYNAKLKGIARAMEAAQEVDLYIKTTATGDLSVAQIRDKYRRALAVRGIDVDKSAEENLQNMMPSGARLRDKYGKPKP